MPNPAGLLSRSAAERKILKREIALPAAAVER
jgi:hypothetical protein